jgi:hypothetical protein
MQKYVFIGDSWACKGYTNENFTLGVKNLPSDIRLADSWGLEYKLFVEGGLGNLVILERFQKRMKVPPTMPIILVYTEPGRDYGILTGDDEFNWITREDIFELRQQLDKQILTRIREQIPNPIGLIGGMSDINTELAESLGFTVLHPSWQKWISETVESHWFTTGWGAADIGWRLHSNNVTPSKAATFAWDERIKEYCWWEEHGYFCHEHPSPRANTEFAEFLKPRVLEWLSQYE